MSEQMRSYGTARGTFSLLEFVGRCVVVAGIIAGLILADSASPYASVVVKVLWFLLGASVSVVGLFIVGAAQNWRAGVDTAELTQQMLKVARDQLEVSRQALKQAERQNQSFSTLENAPEQNTSLAAVRSFSSDTKKPNDRTTPKMGRLQATPLEAGEKDIDYKGKTLRLTKAGCLYNGIPFDSVEKAKSYVDKLA